MSGGTRIRAMNVSESEARPVLIPTKNKAERSMNARKTMSKPLKKAEKTELVEEANNVVVSVSPASCPKPLPMSLSDHAPSLLRRNGELVQSNISLSTSVSSDASTDSFHSRASTGRIGRGKTTSRKKNLASKVKVSVPESLPDGLQDKTRCAWVTANTDPAYVSFHDEEWGVPEHNDKKLFELLVLCGALAELTWPTILSKRHIFREVFVDFDPIAVAKMNEKKMIAPGSPASSLLSELKLRAVFENARQLSKVIDEFGSFDKYIWGFVNYKPIVSKFRYPRQVPVKIPKADVISKDLVRRGFRSVGPTVVYSFMQVAGITNDHLTTCFRFHDCLASGVKDDGGINKDRKQDEKVESKIEHEICGSILELNFSSE